MINQIITGDAKKLAKEIPDESVDLIFTDPVYENIEDYRWLAQTAMRVLKPNSACLAWSGWRNYARAQIAMEDAGLNFEWTLGYSLPGKPGALHLYGIYPNTSPCLFLAKGRRKASPYLPDFLTGHGLADNGFRWSKNLIVLNRWLTALSKPGDTVYDPFSGSGSIPTVCKMTGRNFIASEIDPKRAEQARKRVEMTPLPLFHYEPEQERMAI